ncbi:MAG: restriction endonuclease subunit S [Methanolobus sp.]|nr:restriction endonuclease subunit S [Methanolobus sp.]
MQQKNELPEGWAVVTVNDISNDIKYGYTASADKEPVGPHLLRITDIQEGKVDWESVPFCKIAENQVSKYKLRPTDIVFARTGATTGKSYIITSCPKSVFASYLIRLRPNESINPKFLSLFFNTADYWSQISQNVSGIAQPNCNAAKLKELILPLPPLLEQHRIVAAIETLFARLDMTNERLEKVPKILKSFKQTVLISAFDGRLTKDWREQQTYLPDVQDLIEQIRWEREEASKVSGKKMKLITPLTKDEQKDLMALPDGWKWVKIGQVSKVGTGVTPLKKRREFYEDGTIPWVTSGALNDFYVKSASDYVTDIALKETNLKIFPKHTLLVALYGEGKTRGKCSELLIQATTNQAIAAIVQEGTEEEIRQYLKRFLMKNYDDIRMKSLGGVQPNLNLGIIENTAFPICSLPEQQEIVRRVDALFAFADSVETKVAAARERTEQLRQSILAKAFLGELVPTEAELARQEGRDYESAEMLLERVKAEGASSKKKKK